MINSNFQAVMANEDSLLRPGIIIYQKTLLKMTMGNAFVAMVFVSVIVSTNLPYHQISRRTIMLAHIPIS